MWWRLMLRHQTIPYAFFFMLLANTQSGSVVLYVITNWGTGVLIKCPVDWAQSRQIIGLIITDTE